MRLPTLLSFGLLLASLAGCRAAQGAGVEGAGFPRTGDLIRGASLDKALVAQRTLYPYHFVAGGTNLNDLGRRDLRVLAAHFRECPGTLNVQGGGVAPAVYEARVRAVMEALVAAGVEAAQMKTAAGLPGGEGISSERVVQILAKPGGLGQSTAGARSGAGSSGSGGASGLSSGMQ